MTGRGPLRLALAVYRKEVVDALRDRRTLLTVLFSSVLMGPLVLVALSSLVGTLESRAELRELVVDGIERAPTLVNFVQRQTWTLRPAPPDYPARLRDGSLVDPVVVVPAGFEAALQRGEAPRLVVVSDSANSRSLAGSRAAEALLAGFNQERVGLALALRGVSVALVQAVRVDIRDLASTQTRATQITGLLPFFVMMAVLYGAHNAALDTTAGERERGSLEPLLMNPLDRGLLVLGKWGAVATVGLLVALLSCLSFLPGQWVLRSDTLAALFQYGPVEAALFLWVLLPFAAAASALLMAAAIRCRTFKEAQASSTVVLLAASLLPLINVFSLGGEAPWHLWVPALGQNLLLTRVLKGEPLGWAQVLPPFVVCVALTFAGIVFVARRLHDAAVR